MKTKPDALWRRARADVTHWRTSRVVVYPTTATAVGVAIGYGCNRYAAAHHWSDAGKYLLPGAAGAFSGIFLTPVLVFFVMAARVPLMRYREAKEAQRRRVEILRLSLTECRDQLANYRPAAAAAARRDEGWPGPLRLGMTELPHVDGDSVFARSTTRCRS